MQLRHRDPHQTPELQAKQNAVLQRKIADAAAARKKLKELQVGLCVCARMLVCLPMLLLRKKLKELELQVGLCVCAHMFANAAAARKKLKELQMGLRVLCYRLLGIVHDRI